MLTYILSLKVVNVIFLSCACAGAYKLQAKIK